MEIPIVVFMVDYISRKDFDSENLSIPLSLMMYVNACVFSEENLGIDK